MSSIDNYKEQLQFVIDNCSERQAKFYRRMLQDIREVRLVPMSEVLTKEQILLIRSVVEKKQCYKNAYKIAQLVPGVRYAEGLNFISKIVPIDHAFNICGGKYFDATFEICLHKDVTKEEYGVYADYSVEEVADVLLQNNTWGDVYRTKIVQELEG